MCTTIIDPEYAHIDAFAVQLRGWVFEFFTVCVAIESQMDRGLIRRDGGK